MPSVNWISFPAPKEVFSKKDINVFEKTYRPTTPRFDGANSGSGFSIILLNFTRSESKFGYKKDINSTDSSDFYDAFRLRNVIFNEISLTFGRNGAFTLGGGIVSKGQVEVYFYTEDEYFNSKNISGWSAFGVYSFDFGLFEFLLGYREIKIEAKEFKSNKTNSKFSKNLIIFALIIS